MEGETAVDHMPVQSQSGCSGQNWAVSKRGARSLFQVSTWWQELESSAL